MLNQVVLVGRLSRDITINKSNAGNNKVATICLAVPRSFKNSDGSYDTDFIECILFDTVAINTKEYCKKGDIVGVKGRLQTRKVELDSEKIKQIVEVIAEKVTFLSSKRQEEE